MSHPESDEAQRAVDALQLANGMATFARGARLLHEGLVAEGFSESQALKLVGDYVRGLAIGSSSEPA